MVVLLQVAAYVISVQKLARVMGVGRTDLRLFSGLGRVVLAAVVTGLACALARHLLGNAHAFTALAISGVVYLFAYAGWYSRSTRSGPMNGRCCDG